MLVLNLAFASSINNSFLLLGRAFRFWLLLELVIVTWAYFAWRAPRVRLAGAPFAALGGFLVLAFVSVFWSVRTHSTEKRALAFLALALVGLALAAVADARPEAVRRVLEALVAAAAIVALLGLYMLWVSHDQAVQSASLQYPARYRGIGQNPNTVPLLLAPALPLALWLWTRARSRAGKAVAVCAALLFDGSIVASGSRGALIAALVGAAVWLLTLPRSWRLRLALVAAAAAVFAADVAITQIPKPVSPSAVSHRQSGAHRVIRDAELLLPLEDEIGRPGKNAPPIRRTLFGTSGRARAWDAAVHQVARRPVAGYGFGTEAQVFVDRYYGFDSTVPENSYLGVALQLGIVGLVAFLVVLAAVVWVAAVALRRLSGAALAAARACAAVVAAGLVLGMTQSYLTSAGNLASPAVWLAALLLPALAAHTVRQSQ
ncbi:MAG TPA: O-antigen ligase family protein [Gaiellaceae bacterium]|jgi:O-antigen ligase|nr:O-antigen ligase family protein [Gaiellaceae bacterium]